MYAKMNCWLCVIMCHHVRVVHSKFSNLVHKIHNAPKTLLETESKDIVIFCTNDIEIIFYGGKI